MKLKVIHSSLWADFPAGSRDARMLPLRATHLSLMHRVGQDCVLLHHLNIRSRFTRTINWTTNPDFVCALRRRARAIRLAWLPRTSSGGRSRLPRRQLGDFRQPASVWPEVLSYTPPTV